MSARIDQIVDVLQEIWYRQAALGIFRERAVPVVAQRRGVDPRTIHDKLVRQLGPQVRQARDFDRLVGRWLGGDRDPLRQTLLAHAITPADREHIDRFFSDHAL